MLRQSLVGQTNYQDVFDVGVSDEEKRFIDTPAEFIVIATYGPDKCEPFILYDEDNHPVGFAALRVPTLPGSPVGLSRFLISTEWQRRGFGRRHLALLLEYAAHRWPESKRIVLSVHVDAVAAQKLYANAGFRVKPTPPGDHVCMRRNLRDS